MFDLDLIMSSANKEIKFVSLHEGGAVYVHPLTDHHSFIAVSSFKEGEVISPFTAKETHSLPSRFTVQTGEDQHILLWPDHLQYINHSCAPNAFFDTDRYALIAVKDIEEGEEITFFYPSTEWFMAEPFSCLCGSKNCLGSIQGAFFLNKETISSYRISSFIESTWKEKNP